MGGRVLQLVIFQGSLSFWRWSCPVSGGKERWRIVPVGAVIDQRAAWQGGYQRNAPWARVPRNPQEHMSSSRKARDTVSLGYVILSATSYGRPGSPSPPIVVDRYFNVWCGVSGRTACVRGCRPLL